MLKIAPEVLTRAMRQEKKIKNINIGKQSVTACEGHYLITRNPGAGEMAGKGQCCLSLRTKTGPPPGSQGGKRVTLRAVFWPLHMCYDTHVPHTCESQNKYYYHYDYNNKNLKDSTKSLLESINEFSNVSKNEINMQKTMFYADNELSEVEFEALCLY